MITGELKSQIDKVWEAFWTGGLANPITVIEQMTYLLFIRRLDELQTQKESKANLLKKPIEDPLYKTEENELRWSHFKNMDPEVMHRMFTKNEGVFDFLRNVGNRSASFTKFMKGATFMIPTPRLLAQVVEMISNIDMNDRDTKGDVYEYMLGKIASAGQNGQFRTPRHIIRMVVDMVEPTLEDVICDPACGTAGFLTVTGEYIREHFEKELYTDTVKKHFQDKMFMGMEFDPTMIRIGGMNLMLHGIENPHLIDVDALSEANSSFTEKTTLVLANPPFKGSLDRDSVDGKILAVVNSKKTELLFLALILKGLKLGGRAAVIVPDGVLFGSSNAHQQIRKELIDRQKLQAVISMPSGVFKPYAGVSTAVLLFTKTNSGGTDKVWFYDMQADGLSLDDKRQPIEANDIPDIVSRYRNPKPERVKFWQMIGRGTRLCKDLFAIDKDKNEFVIFDFCENFEFFNVNPKGIAGNSSKSLSQRLFELRLRLAFVLLGQGETELKEYGQSIIDQLVKQTQSLNGESFIIRQHWEVVDKYRDANAWNALTDLDIKELHDHIAPLMMETDQDELAKRFDTLMLDIQLSVLNGEKKQTALIQKVVSTAGKLSKKASIPSVAQKMDTIKEVQQKIFWEAATIPGIERIRIELRDIIKFLDSENTPIYFTMFEDEFMGNIQEHQLVYGFNDLDAYKRKVEQYLKAQSSNITIHKLRNNAPITKGELETLERMLFEQGTIGTKTEFKKAYGEQPFGKFIRSIVGLDVQAAKLAFAEILNNQTLNAQQIRFMDTIINFLNVKGIIEPSMLFEAPFTDINLNGVTGLFDEIVATKIISLIEVINHNAEAA